jgi:hypothetical protein
MWLPAAICRHGSMHRDLQWKMKQISFELKSAGITNVPSDAYNKSPSYADNKFPSYAYNKSASVSGGLRRTFVAQSFLG